MIEALQSIYILKSAIASALIGGDDPSELAETSTLLDNLRAVQTTDPQKRDACIEAIGNGLAFAGTSRKIVLARAQRYLTSLSIELADAEPPAQTTRRKSKEPAIQQAAAITVDPGLLSLKGIGPKSAQRLMAFGIHTPLEILFFLPRRYDDRRQVCPISQLQPGMRCVTEGIIDKVSVFGKPWKSIMQVEIREGDSSVLGMWFTSRRPAAARFVRGQRLKMAGLVSLFKNKIQIAHPQIAIEGEPCGAMDRIVPVYPEIPGIPGATLEKAIHSALERSDELLQDPVPQSLLTQRNLMPLSEALRLVHIPPEDIPVCELDAWVTGSSPAHRRMAYDEFFFIQLALGLRKAGDSRIGAPQMQSSVNLTDRTAHLMGFSPTSAQQRVIVEIQRDLCRKIPMRRLLQGDVGSGKTMVALAAIIACVESGFQAALMAPTEILAEQHMRTLYPALKKLGIRAALHIGNARSSARKQFMEQLGNNRIQVAIGTHALISESVHFPNLGLAIVDEQHRFGVSQRLGLQGKAKDGMAPHLLVMTATPIPRSLALTVHGDLDISILDELPPGRCRVTTTFIASGCRDKALQQIAAALGRGEQAYVVCPIIEQSDTLDVSDTETTHAFYKEYFGPECVGLLHGRLAPEERDLVMDKFVRNEIGILVCTTVIEVGVNIPNATVMVIEGCERFGLAQLHQLRGRVGRSELESSCLLIGDPTTQESLQRIDTLTASTDGFHIAEMDLKIRGPGELFGRRQAGLPGFRFGNLQRDMDLLLAAREDALKMLAESPALACTKYRAVGEELKRRILAGDGPVGEESG